MIVVVGILQGKSIVMDSEEDRDAIALIRHLQDELERLTANDFAEVMGRLKDNEAEL